MQELREKWRVIYRAWREGDRGESTVSCLELLFDILSGACSPPDSGSFIHKGIEDVYRSCLDRASRV